MAADDLLQYWMLMTCGACGFADLSKVPPVGNDL